MNGAWSLRALGQRDGMRKGVKKELPVMKEGSQGTAVPCKLGEECLMSRGKIK